MDTIRISLSPEEWKDLFSIREQLVIYAVFMNYSCKQYSKGIAEDYLECPMVEVEGGERIIILEAETLCLVKDFLYDSIYNGVEVGYFEDDVDLKALAEAFGLVIK